MPIVTRSRPCRIGLRLAMPTAWVPPMISGASEQAVGPDRQHQRHEQEHHHERALRKDQDAEGLQLTDDQGGEKGTRNAAHAADHGDDESIRR